MTTTTIPVLLLTGYLGAGKTTLLNRILTNEHGYRFAVLVNDLGEVNIDAALIEQGGVVTNSDDSLVALQNGCICCTLKVDLARQLCTLAAAHRFDYIVIEASGICEPLPIAQTICSIPYMDEPFVGDITPVLDCIVTVVDALRMADEFAAGSALVSADIEEDDIENLVIQQIEFCNIVLLNKASMVSHDDLARLTEIVRTLQPQAEIIPCDYGEVDLRKLVGTKRFDFNSVATAATWIQELERPASADNTHAHDDDDDDDDGDAHHHAEHHHHDHHHDHNEGEAEEYGIGTYVYHSRYPMDITLFDEFVARHWPKTVIRAKGMCYFATEQHICYLFEQAGRQFSLRNCGQWYATMPAEELKTFLARNPQLQQDWDATYGDRQQKIVFIGQHLDTAEIKAALDACLTT